MKITELPSGNYRAQLVIGYDDKGKRIVKSFTADEEWKVLKMVKDFQDNQVVPKNKRLTVAEAFEAYIQSRDNILSPSTIRGYRIIKRSRLKYIKDIYIDDLKTGDIQRAANLDAKRLSRKSIKSALSLLKSALAMQDIDINIDKITVPAKKKQPINIPTAEEVAKIIIGTDIELPCLLAMWLSLRISEVRGLKFSDISKDGKYITIQRAKICLDNTDFVREQNKTLESTRTNQLPKYIKELIDKVPRESEDDFIVTKGYHYISKKFTRLMANNGYEMTFHKLRHEFATTLNDLGVPSNYIQKLGGWSTDNVMKSVYTHTTSSKESEYQDKINKYFDLIIGSCDSV